LCTDEEAKDGDLRLELSPTQPNNWWFLPKEEGRKYTRWKEKEACASYPTFRKEGDDESPSKLGGINEGIGKIYSQSRKERIS